MFRQFSPFVIYAAPYTIYNFLDAPVSIFEVQNVVKKWKLKTAPGNDRILGEFFKHCASKFLSILTQEYNNIFETANIPKSFKRVVIFILHKKRCYQNPKNYRGISFLNILVKLFSALIFNRLTFWTKNKNIFNEFQAGFRKKCSTLDQVLTLQNITKSYKKRNKKFCAT